jgi:hypothetical protein
MADLALSAPLGPELGAVIGAVARVHPFDDDPVLSEPGHRSFQEPDGRRGPLVVEDLDVGQTGGVIDADVVDELTGWRRQRELRSSRPAGPSLRKRASHL